MILSSTAEPQLSFSGDAVLTFSNSPAKATISYNDGDILVSVSDIPINALTFLYKVFL